jgi:hypothetical protein
MAQEARHSSVAAKVRNEHAKLAPEERGQRIEHRAADHQPVQKEQRFTIAHDFVEDTV